MSEDNDRITARRGGCRAGVLLNASMMLLCTLPKSTGVTNGRNGDVASLGKEPSTSSSDTITRVAFGSCNKQYLPQPMWRSIEDLSPDVWLWIGDAVYVDKFSDGNVDKMKEAIRDQLAIEDYQRFVSKVPRIEGVWDDHDYGVNDAGKELLDHPGRVDAFLDFLGAGKDDPRRGGARLYSSHEFGEAPRKVKVLQLDLRTARDKYYIFNVSGKRFNFAAMLGAVLRWVTHSLCLGSDYDGAMIGEDQWEWLEAQLSDSDAAVHVLVSTLQMLTSNPLVESWGHFPRSRDRMLELLRRTNPAGLVILSGDVHHAELASGWKQSPQESHEDSMGDECAAHALPGRERTGDTGAMKRRGVVEVTSSGMTHSCMTTHGRTMCEAYLQSWRQHRWRDDAYYMLMNFGDIKIEWAEEEDAPQPAKMTISVRDTNGTIVLPTVEFYGNPEKHELEASAAMARGAGGAELADGVGKMQKPGAVEEETRHIGRAFLDRSPPPECVEPVLQAGCTRRNISAILVAIAIVWISCWGLFQRKKRYLKDAKAYTNGKLNSRHENGAGRNVNGNGLNGSSASASTAVPAAKKRNASSSA